MGNLRRCEACHGPGPVLYCQKAHRYCCRKCHSESADPFFEDTMYAHEVVRAVNAHDALVSALEACLPLVRDASDAIEGSWQGVQLEEQVIAALKLAKEGK